MRDPIETLFEEIRLLHRRAGEPSTRTIARSLGRGVLSHTTVNAVLRGSRVPHWGPLELVVQALGGDVERFKELWLEARGASDSPAAVPPPRMASPASLIGRRQELRLMQDWVTDLTTGQGRAVLVEGAPGIGKSALLRTAASEAVAAGCQVFWTACDELSQAFPLLPLLSTIDSPAAAAGRGRARIADIFRAESAPGNQMDLVAAATERLLALIDELCTASSVLLVVDDLQWADPATVRCLGRLTHTTQRLPLLVAAVTRTVPQRADLRALRRSIEPAARVRLHGLTEAEVTEFVAGTVGGVPGPRLLKLASDAGGNPLYLTELVDALVRGGTVTTDMGQVEFAAGRPPESLSAAIASRLEFLSPLVRTVLRTAALQGVSFSVAELAVVSGKSLGELVPLLNEASDAGVLRDDGHELAFHHPLIRAALYEETSVPTRAAWHRDAARKLAETGASADRVARQLLPSLEAAGGDGPSDEWIVRWLAEVGQSLVNRAPQAAISLLRVAMRGMPAGVRPRDRLTATLADALYRVGDAAEAARVAGDALDHVSDPDLLVSLLWTLTQSRAVHGRHADSLATLESALDSPSIAPRHRARLLVLAARTHCFAGRVDAAGRLADAALATALAANDRWATSWALAAQTVVLGMKGDSAASLPLYDRALALAGGDPALADLRLVLGINRAVALGNLDRHGDAIKAAEQVRQLADDAGNAVRRLQAQSVLSELLFETGQWDDALVETDIERHQSNEPVTLCVSLSLAALIGLHRGDASAAQRLASADRYASRLGDRVLGPYVLAKSLAHERSGAPEAALGVLLATLARTEDVETVVAVLANAARLAVAVGDKATARSAADRAVTVAGRSDMPRRQAILAYCRGLVGNDQALLLQAARYYQVGSQVLPRAQALEAAAAAAADAGDMAAARSHFTNALFLYTVLHADWDLGRVHARIRGYGISL
ncbi:ATP-binding protein [Phytohabitans rumicis]|uniref:LuxR family transcriptional regulator n=1 Tax=Phytohabitans rumicis TaxID=1076125 RepID=A0A6V8L7G1_9ACTN|nr:AAA family ATPase [Phytohabitans rumicis]GFJ88595.1 LuxR family transcriptional regulator [Phytohabitans rumicis]